MARVWIQEYRQFAVDAAGNVAPCGLEPGHGQCVAFNASRACEAFRANTKLIRVVADEDCHVAFGENPEATTESALVPAMTVVFFGVRSGERMAVTTGE